MIKSTKIIAFFTILVITISCKTNKYSFLNKYPVKNLPITDSTNFSNHVEGKLLTKEEQEKLALRDVFGEQLDTQNVKAGISYLPKISDKFTSVVFYLYSDNTELTSVLVNYDQDFKIINNQMVAYDEIADGLLKSQSMIYNDKIVLKEFVSESASIIKFDILENGDITRE